MYDLEGSRVMVPSVTLRQFQKANLEQMVRMNGIEQSVPTIPSLANWALLEIVVQLRDLNDTLGKIIAKT